MIKILIVEDDRELNSTLCKFLNMNGYEAAGCLDAQSAYDEMYGSRFDLIISDIMMPKIDGFEFAESVRDIDKDIPIIFMTAKDDIASKQRGYKLGIDDYLVKPVDFDELLLKLGAILRRANIDSNKALTIGSFSLNSDTRTAVYNGEEIPLTVREFDLLYRLLSYPKKTFTRSQLMNDFWDIDANSSL
ncbi:MAG: response regulator transcription factor [Ruminiclostridium sp.]|nr:response regulator transcription factor [Ruminiclostridium sp.]